jgi:hypothetical protein
MRGLSALLGAVALVLTSSFAAVSAHEGHAHKVMGVVAAVHENHVEVKDLKGVSSTHTLDAKTKIRRNKAVMSLSDIKVGDRVVVTYIESKDKAGKKVVTVTEVQVGIAATPTKKR